jgi:hypothetical protein
MYTQQTRACLPLSKWCSQVRKDTETTLTIPQAKKLIAESPEADARLRLAYNNIQDLLLATAAVYRDHAAKLEEQAADTERILETIPLDWITEPLKECRPIFIKTN